ncbi:MAG: hypothetical protein V4488_02970 [Pseudomonadota bacterium]
MFPRLTDFHKFALALLLLLAALFTQQKVVLNGDVYEYTVMSVALASHLSPDIQSADLHKVQRLLPQYAPYFQATEEGIKAGKQMPSSGFYRARDSNVYSIHFFSYSALAVLPLLAFEKIGVDPFQSFWFVNLVFVFILGLSLYRFFGSAARTCIGLALFVLCGGFNYGLWSSPECMSAAAVLSAMLLFATGAPVFAGLLAGLASTQNPPIVCFLALGPVLHLCLHYQRGLSFRANLRNTLDRRMLAGIAAGTALFLLPICFSLLTFGVPNIIAKTAASPSLMTPGRLHSFFFDWNQGMIIGIPGVWIGCAVLWWRCRRSKSTDEQWRLSLVVLCNLGLALALAIPALATTNWNSAAVGMMRYVFWGAMPFLFLFLFLLRQQRRLPVVLLLFIAALQVQCAYSAQLYSELGLSSMAKFMLRKAPAWYNPDPEIFVERTVRQDGITLDTGKYYAYDLDGQHKKLMFHESSRTIDTELCGPNKLLSLDTHVAAAGFGWHYINGPVRCDTVQTLSFTEFKNGRVQFNSGWSRLEQVRPEADYDWNGIWSDGPSSTMTIAVEPARPVQGVKIFAHYFGNNQRTRVVVNGEDMGWVDLRKRDFLQVKQDVDRPLASLKIELTHEAPHDPATDPAIPRRLGMFVHAVALR